MNEQLRRQEQRTLRVLSDQNDQRRNLRVYNVEEKAGETADGCARKWCQIFTDLIDVPTREEGLEAAHRTGPTTTGKRRPIIVRFQSRKLKDKVLANRRNLKKKTTTKNQGSSCGRTQSGQLQTGQRCVQTFTHTCIMVLIRKGFCRTEER